MENYKSQNNYLSKREVYVIDMDTREVVAWSQNNYLSKREVYHISDSTMDEMYIRLKITTSQRERFMC